MRWTPVPRRRHPDIEIICLEQSFSRRRTRCRHAVCAIARLHADTAGIAADIGMGWGRRSTKNSLLHLRDSACVLSGH